LPFAMQNLLIAISHNYFSVIQQANCILGQSDIVKGTITIKQFNTYPRVVISGKVTGLTPGLHGFHVHEYGDLTDGCTSFGGHYNPFERTHGMLIISYTLLQTAFFPLGVSKDSLISSFQSGLLVADHDIL